MSSYITGLLYSYYISISAYHVDIIQHPHQLQLTVLATITVLFLTYLSKLLMLYIKLSLLHVGVHAPQTLQGHPSSGQTRFHLNLTQRKSLFRGLFFPLAPNNNFPCPHFRSTAVKTVRTVRTHVPYSSRTVKGVMVEMIKRSKLSPGGPEEVKQCPNVACLSPLTPPVGLDHCKATLNR